MRDQLTQLRKSRMMALSTGVPFTVDFRAQPRSEGDEKSHLWIYDMIDDLFGVSASMVVEALLASGGRDLVIHLNSPGGSVIEAIAIYNNIRTYPHDVEVRIEGGALSAASFIAVAGNRTLIEPSGMMMLHDAWDVTAGNAAEHRRVADVLDQASDTMSEVYAKKTGGTAEEWRTILKAERWYKAQQAKDAGLVDDVLSDETAGAQAKWGSFVPARNDSNIAAGALSGVDLDSLRESLKGAFA